MSETVNKTEVTKTGKVAVIGDKDSVLAFKAVGAEVFTPANLFETNELLRKMARGGYAVVFITEDYAVEVPDTLKKLKTRAYPAVIPIPSSSGSTGLGMKGIREDVEKAIGVDILFND